MNDAEKIAAIRELFSRFNWETDDRQYALEEIERIVGEPEPEARPTGALSYILDGDFPQ